MLRLLDRGLMIASSAAAVLIVVLLFAGPSLIGAKKTSATAAGATGAIGPNLDQVRPTAATVAATGRSGAGSMPSFAGKLTDAQIAAVGSYVSSVAGR
jgi:mono/diheme cytochrome c family protein